MKKTTVFCMVLICLVGVLCAVTNDTYTPPAEPQRGCSPWGQDDQRGAANLLTAEKVLEAKSLIHKGKIYSLGRLYEDDMPFFPGRQYTMRIPAISPPAGINRVTAHEELLITQIGQVGTQLDALGHAGIGDTYYNGFDRKEFITPTGLTKLGIENVGVFFTRGVLLDIAALKGKTRLEGGEEITVQDLQDALDRQQVEICKGDIVLIHTGWGMLWGVDNEKYAREEPGLGVAAAEFLVNKEVVLVGADNFAVEAIPHTIPDAAYPVHQIFLTLNGIYLLENLDLSEMVRDKVYEFAFFFAPLKLKGATGSPGNPVAIY